MKKLTIQAFDEIKNSGHGVPRNKAREIITSFKVGKEYDVKKEGTQEIMRVRCTQDCPTHLKIIQS